MTFILKNITNRPFLCQPSEDSSKTYKSLHLKTNLAPLCLARQERLAVSPMTTTSVQRSSTPLHLHYSFSLNPKCPTSTMESDTSKSTIPFHFSTPTIHRANSPTSQPRHANTSNLANGPLDLLPLLLNTWGQPSDRIFSLCPQHSIPPRLCTHSVRSSTSLFLMPFSTKSSTSKYLLDPQPTS